MSHSVADADACDREGLACPGRRAQVLSACKHTATGDTAPALRGGVLWGRGGDPDRLESRQPSRRRWSREAPSSRIVTYGAVRKPFLAVGTLRGHEVDAPGAWRGQWAPSRAPGWNEIESGLGCALVGERRGLILQVPQRLLRLLSRRMT